MSYPQPTPTAGLFNVIVAELTPAITYGDTVQFRLRVQNIYGSRLTLGRYFIGYMDSGDFIPALYFPGGPSIAAGSTTERTITYTTGAATGPDAAYDTNFSDMCAALITAGTRAENGLTLQINATDAGGTNHVGYYPLSLDYYVFDRRYTPSIPVLDVGRYDAGGQDDDGGEYVWLTATLADTVAAPVGLFSCRLYYAQDQPPTTDDSYIDLTADINDLLAGVTKDQSLITQTFLGNHSWFFLMVYGDAYETAQALTSVGTAFAVMHLAGASTGGVAIGMFSTATEGDPKMESAPPGYFYGGFAEAGTLANGEIATGLRWIDGKMIYAQAVSGTFTGTSEQKIGQLANALSIDAIVRITGAALMGSSGNRREINSNNSSSYTYCYVNTSGEVYAQSSVTGSKTFNAIILYTKT